MLTRMRDISARQGDALLAVVLYVVLVVELSTAQNITGSRAVNYGFGLVVCGAVAWRRPWPVIAVSAQLVALILEAALGGDLIENTFSPILALLVSFYAVGAYAPDPWSNRGLAIGVLGVVLVDLAGGQTQVGDFAFPLLVLVGAPWLAGRISRVWAQRALELARLNETLRAEQEQRALLAVAGERERIARELHDVVAHSISVMVVQAEGAKRMMDRDRA